VRLAVKNEMVSPAPIYTPISVGVSMRMLGVEQSNTQLDIRLDISKSTAGEMAAAPALK